MTVVELNDSETAVGGAELTSRKVADLALSRVVRSRVVRQRQGLAASPAQRSIAIVRAVRRRLEIRCAAESATPRHRRRGVVVSCRDTRWFCNDSCSTCAFCACAEMRRRNAGRFPSRSSPSTEPVDQRYRRASHVCAWGPRCIRNHNGDALTNTVTGFVHTVNVLTNGAARMAYHPRGPSPRGGMADAADLKSASA